MISPRTERSPQTLLTQSTLKEFTFDNTAYVAPTWEQMGQFTFDLAKQILESGKTYDRVVALAKGGWTWTRTLVDYLGIDNIASVQIKFYNGINQTMETPQIIQLLATPINGEKLLLFDEVIDTGTTAKKAKSYLVECGAASVDIATLCYKPQSVIRPDFYAFQTSAWVFFPHEIREAVAKAGGEWLKNGLTKDEVISRFETVGLPPDQIRYFVAKI